MASTSTGAKFNNQKGVHLIHLNIHSFNPRNYNLLNLYLRDSNIKCATISETWFHSNVDSRFYQIHGYQLIRADRQTLNEGNEIKRGGGLAFYIHNSISFSDTELHEFNASDKNIEIQWVVLKPNNAKQLTVANIYKPPTACNDKFRDYLNYCLDNIPNKQKRDLYLMGDLNLNFLKPTEPSVKRLKVLMAQHGLKQVINEPTRYPLHHNPTLIDLIFTNSTKVANAGVLNVSISDHEMIYITKKQNKREKELLEFKGRSYRNYDKEKFVHDLQSLDWTDVLNESNPERIWNEVLQRITDLT